MITIDPHTMQTNIQSVTHRERETDRDSQRERDREGDRSLITIDPHRMQTNIQSVTQYFLKRMNPGQVKVLCVLNFSKEILCRVYYIKFPTNLQDFGKRQVRTGLNIYIYIQGRFLQIK